MTTLRLSDFGATFATRQRVDEIGAALQAGDRITIDFAGVKVASPSFVDELLGLVSEAFSQADIAGASDDIGALIERVIARRDLQQRFRLTAAA